MGYERSRPVTILFGPGTVRQVDRPVWGHRDGLRIGLAPTPGPQGLIRVYAPYLGQSFPRVINFLSIEPAVTGQSGRGQSELELSRDRPGERGLTFRASNDLETTSISDQLPTGTLDRHDESLRLFVHPEPFANGARVIVEIVFHADQRHEIGLVTHLATGSAPLDSCVISATMGNYGLLRQLHLAGGRIEPLTELGGDERLDRLGFLPWQMWPPEDFKRSGGDYLVKITSDFADPDKADYAESVPPHWRYQGLAAAHHWRAEPDAEPWVALNARRTYWGSNDPIPGGACFENFELQLPFRSGRRLWFGIEPVAD